MESGQGRIVSDIYGTDARNMFAHPLRSTGQERRSQRGGDGNETLRRYRTETVIRCAIQANHERRTIVSANGLKPDIGPHIDEAEAAAVIHGDTKFRRQFVKCGIAGQPCFKLGDNRADVQNRVGIEPRKGTGDHIAHGFPARVLVQQTGDRDRILQIGQVFRGYAAQLKIGAAGEVDLAVAPTA